MYMLFFILSLIFMLVLQFQRSKKKFTINSHKEIEGYINEMCEINTIPPPKIDIENNFSFSPIGNIIKVKSKISNNLEYFIAALHEAGHYIEYNNKSFLNKVTKITLPVLVINRVIVMPAYIIVVFLIILNNFDITTGLANILFKKVFLLIFILASVIRLTIGIHNEMQANKYVLKFLEGNYTDINILDVKVLMALAMVSQVLMSIAWIFMIIYIYKSIFAIG